MEDLVPLVRLVSGEKIQQIDLFNGKKDLPYKSRVLYEGLLSGSIKNDDDALIALYNNEVKNKKNLFKLKNRLLKRLLNTVVFFDSSKKGLTDRRKIQLELGRSTVIVNILFDRAQYKLGIKLAKKTFTVASKMEFPFYATEMAVKLCGYYALTNKSEKKFRDYSKLLEKVKQDYAFENIVNQYYHEVSLNYSLQKGAVSQEYIERLKTICEHLELIQTQTKSFKTNLRAYNLRSSYYILIRKYDKAIVVVEEALEFFRNKPFKDLNSEFLFRTNLILSAIGNSNLDLALTYSNENLKLVPENTRNWYTQRNYRFIILTGLEDYQSLYSLTLEVVNSKKYKNYALQNEYWKVIEGYIQFMIRLGVIDPSLDDSGLELKPFRLNKFLNEVPKYSKDKRGLNVSILVVQFLFLLLDKKYDAIIDRADALKQYTYRYLKNDETFRSNLFLKLLIKVIEQDFHPVAVERHTQKLFARLHETKRNTDFQSNQLEIIPYEKMWEFVQQLLEKNYREG